MSAVCPNGHPSAADDFCDTCGAKIDLAAIYTNDYVKRANAKYPKG